MCAPGRGETGVGLGRRRVWLGLEIQGLSMAEIEKPLASEGKIDHIQCPNLHLNQLIQPGKPANLYCIILVECLG